MNREPVAVGGGHKGAPGSRSTNPSSPLYGVPRGDSGGARRRDTAIRRDNANEPVIGGYRSPTDPRE
jgi:hypothetical protein